MTYWVISISFFRQTIRLSAKVYLPPPPLHLTPFVRVCDVRFVKRWWRWRQTAIDDTNTWVPAAEAHSTTPPAPTLCHASRGVVDRPMPRVGFRGEDVCFDRVTPPGTERQIGRCTRETIPRPWDKWAPLLGGTDGPRTPFPRLRSAERERTFPSDTDDPYVGGGDGHQRRPLQLLVRSSPLGRLNPLMGPVHRFRNG